MARPLGVSILAVLAFLAGILLLAVGALALLAAGVFQEALLAAIAAVSVIMGILYLVGGIGLWRLTMWGWWMAVIASLISLISTGTQVAVDTSTLLTSIPSLALALIILIYLFVVRGHFGTSS